MKVLKEGCPGVVESFWSAFIWRLATLDLTVFNSVWIDFKVASISFSCALDESGGLGGALIPVFETFGDCFPWFDWLNLVALSDSAAIAELVTSISSSSATNSFLRSGLILARMVSSTRPVSRACKNRPWTSPSSYLILLSVSFEVNTTFCRMVRAHIKKSCGLSFGAWLMLASSW